MRHIRTIAIAFLVFGGLASGAMAKDTKGVADKVQTCKAKMSAKTIPKGQWQAEHDKCMGDPVNYQ